MLRTARTARTASAYFIRAARFSVARRALASVMEMPAMSPTMSQGGIVEWKVKAGDSFAAGDVLLDIETDKAQISVDAQDDGVMAKILLGNGEKDVPVGKPIAVLAEPDEDVSSIDFESLASKAEKPDPKPTESESKAEKPASKPDKTARPGSRADQPEKEPERLLPSVMRALALNDLSEEDAKKIKGTGPEGRILKGDVLAFVGEVRAETLAKEQKRFEQWESLELPKMKDQKPEPEQQKPQPQPQPKPQPKPKVVETKRLTLETLPPSSEQTLRRTVAKAVRLAVRDSILAAKPKPSVLRDPALDFVCAPANKVSFEHAHFISRGKLELTVQHQGNNKQAGVFLERVEFYLGEGYSELLV